MLLIASSSSSYINVTSIGKPGHNVIRKTSKIQIRSNMIKAQNFGKTENYDILQSLKYKNCFYLEAAKGK